MNLFLKYNDSAFIRCIIYILNKKFETIFEFTIYACICNMLEFEYRLRPLNISKL